MFNSRIICIDNIARARSEIMKIGVDEDSLTWLEPKAMLVTIKVDGISSFAANVIKQEMLSKGGDVAVNRGCASCSIIKSDILIMGTLAQYHKLIRKLKLQPPSLKQIGSELSEHIQIIENGKSKIFTCSKYRFPIGEKTYIMGILNVTPDSFSDGGQYSELEVAMKWAKEMVENGADIIDVGGESTRPGHSQVDSKEEINRVVPVISLLSKELNVPISVDTSKADVALKALEAGASIVNDVWGFQRDENIAKVVADHKAGAILMHNSDNMNYDDVVYDIIKYLRKSVKIASDAGIINESIMIDPGIGFGKTTEQNLETINRLNEISLMGLPVLIGTSRKSVIGNVLGLPVGERLEGTAATVTMSIVKGADVVRVHDVREMARVTKMTDAMVREGVRR